MLLAIDKPKGITSYDVIRILKKEFPKQKIGHSGTLDPMATGLLIVGVGKGTKSLANYQGLSKSYITTIDFSQDTDTRDLDFWEKHTTFSVSDELGKKGIIKSGDFVNAPTMEELKNKLDLLVPSYSLPLTPFSAKKKGGKKMYELAREGKADVEYRDMRVNGYNIIDYTFPLLKLELDVGSGTYIRSIGHWLGTELNLGGILVELRRISIGEIKLSEITNTKKITTDFKGKEVTIKYSEI